MRRASSDLPAPVGPSSRIGAADRTVTRSSRSTISLNEALRVWMPDFRSDRSSQLVARESGRDPIVLGEIEIDDAERAGIAARVPRRRARLQQAAGNVARLRQQEQADLRDVRAGRDVDEVILGLGVERRTSGRSRAGSRTPLRSPRDPSSRSHEAHLGLGRDMTDVVAHGLGQRGETLRVQQLEAIDQQVFVLAAGDARPPDVPAPRALPRSIVVPRRPIATDGLHMYSNV